MSTPAAPSGGISPAPIEPAPPRGGCARAALIGCGITAIVVIVCFAIFTLYVRRRPEAVTDLMVSQIEKNYASDVTPEEKQELRDAYAGFRAALRERRVRREDLDRLRFNLRLGRGPVSREQVREITRIFREATGQPTRGPLPSPSPPGAATPSAPAARSAA